MFDNLGNFTQQQLLEREAAVASIIYSLASIIEGLEAKKKRIFGRVVTDDSRANERTYSITHTCGDTVYSYATSHIPKVATGGSFARDIAWHARNSRFPIRVDPVGGDHSLGDAVFRPYARLFEPGKSKTSQERSSADDTVVAHLSEKFLRPFREVFKRAEGLEEKSKKAKYKYLMLCDQIEELQNALDLNETRRLAIRDLLDNTQEIVNSAGEVEQVSEYPTAGIDLKTEVLSEQDVEVMIDQTSPPATEPASTAAEADAPANLIHPAPPGVVVAVPLPDNAKPGNLKAFQAAFPISGALEKSEPSRVIPLAKQKILASIFEYNLGVFEELPTSGLVRRDPNRGTYKYILPNVHAGLLEMATYVTQTYGLSIEVTEAWPPTINHESSGHFTGNAVDVILVFSGITLPGGKAWDGIAVTDELSQAVFDKGIAENWYSSGKNEYIQDTRLKTGKHLHLAWKGEKAIYNNDARLLSLGISAAELAAYKVP